MFSTIDPRNSQVISTYRYMTDSQLFDCLERASSSFILWRQTAIDRRRALMMAFAELLERHVEELASLISREMGKHHHEALGEVKKCAFLARYSAEQIESWLKPREVLADGIQHQLCLEPLGVTLSIMPWNFPFWQVLRAAIPSLLGGNVVVLKHAESTTGCGLRLQELFLQAGFPQDVFQVIICDHQQAAKVIAHPSIRLVSFTGSCRAGQHIGRLAGENLKKCILELGGSDPFLVFPDADLDKVIPAAIMGRFLNAGQVCISAKRFIVHQQIAGAFTRRFVEEVKKLQIAPLINSRAREQIEHQVQRALEEGAKVLCGGDKAEGNYYRPTVLVDVSNHMSICQEEVFGPVAPIIECSTIQEMIDCANRSAFGLGASIWTSNLEFGREVAKQVECGAVFINSIVKSDPRVPFGGIKNSGFGVEMTEFGLFEVMNLKTYNLYS